MPFVPADERAFEVSDVDSVFPTELTTDFLAKATAFLRLRDKSKSVKTQQDGIRDELMALLEQYGYDDNGSQVLDLPKAVLGVTKLIRQRRASQKFDEEKAERLLRTKGLWEQCTQTVQVLDEDAVMAALYSGDLTEADIEEIFPVKETYALVPK